MDGQRSGEFARPVRGEIRGASSPRRRGQRVVAWPIEDPAAEVRHACGRRPSRLESYQSRVPVCGHASTGSEVHESKSLVREMPNHTGQKSIPGPQRVAEAVAGAQVIVSDVTLDIEQHHADGLSVVGRTRRDQPGNLELPSE